MKKTKITILLLSALMMSFASCKTQSSKKVEYIEEPITVEAEQDSQKKNVPESTFFSELLRYRKLISWQL